LAPPDELLEEEPELDEPEPEEPEPDEPEPDEPEPELDEEVDDELEAAAGLAEPFSEDDPVESGFFESDLVSESFAFSAVAVPARESLR
jgi:hypothetical protein